MINGDLCDLCPRHCRAERDTHTGFCGVNNKIKIAKAFLHQWEEPCISGSKGSGTIFFSGCNLKCVYCQNYKISQESFGKEVSDVEFCDILYRLKEKGAHNINLVTPTHYIHKIVRLGEIFKELDIPIIYNSNGYENVESIKRLEGIIDVYLPDIKYIDAQTSERYSKADDYFTVASEAVIEMSRQVGTPIYDEKGIIKRGLVIRHLVLPGHTRESKQILYWIKENLPNGTVVSLMSQYTPYFMANEFTEINRRLTKREYEKVVDYFFELGFENGYVQERSSAKDEYIPDFNLEGI